MDIYSNSQPHIVYQYGFVAVVVVVVVVAAVDVVLQSLQQIPPI